MGIKISNRRANAVFPTATPLPRPLSRTTVVEGDQCWELAPQETGLHGAAITSGSVHHVCLGTATDISVSSEAIKLSLEQRQKETLFFLRENNVQHSNTYKVWKIVFWRDWIFLLLFPPAWKHIFLGSWEHSHKKSQRKQRSSSHPLPVQVLYEGLCHRESWHPTPSVRNGKQDRLAFWSLVSSCNVESPCHSKTSWGHVCPNLCMMMMDHGQSQLDLQLESAIPYLQPAEPQLLQH